MNIKNMIRTAVIATLALVTVAPLDAGDRGRGRNDRYGRYDKHAYKHRGKAYRGSYYGRPAYYGPSYYAPRQCARPVIVAPRRPVYYDPYYYEAPVVVAPRPLIGVNVIIR